MDNEEYRDFEEGSWQKHLFDLKNLPFKEYLLKYHSFIEPKWNQWIMKFIDPAYDIVRHDEMIRNFGYKSIDKHNFEKQLQFYNELKKDNRLDEDFRKFIGFMAGNHFFDKVNMNVEEWFNSYYWTNDLKKHNLNINEILNLPNGLNYLKSSLIELNWWKRDIVF
jgi:hypothetical protein